MAKSSTSGKGCQTQGPDGIVTLLPGQRAEIYQHTAALYEPPTWELVNGSLVRLLLQHPYFLLHGNPQVNVARELELLEKESYRFGLDTFQEEFLRLFVNGPDGVLVPPYASFYTEGRLFGKAAQEAAAFYRQFDIAPEAEAAGPPDHIVYELEFLSFLCSLEQSSLEADHMKRALELSQAQKDFFTEHVFSWMNRFCDRLYEKSRLAYYQVLASLTKGFLHHDWRHLKGT